MRIPLILIMMSSLYIVPAVAATVDLKDGQTVQGDIVQRDGKSLQINVDGVTMTYYADEIKDVDGNPFASDQATAPAPDQAAVPQTQPADQAATPQAQPTDQTTVPQPPAAEATPPAEAAAPQQPDTTPSPAATTSADGIDPEKRALILKFIEVFGTRQALTNNFSMMLQQIEKEKPEEAQKIRDRVKIDEIIERLLPVYDRNFSTDDLKAFIAFYSSPEGQKLINTIPELMKESVQESIKYMEEKFPEVNQGH